jgi:hypothetical protein
VAWIDGRDEYWIHNSLSDSLGNGEMLAIAEQTSPISGSSKLAARAVVSLRNAHVPVRLSTTSTLSLRQKLGAIAALVAVLLIVMLAFLLFRRRRDIRSVRERIAVGLTTSARLAPAGGWAAAGGSGAAGQAGLDPGSVINGNGHPTGWRRIRPSMVLAAILILMAGGGLGVGLTLAGNRVVNGKTHTKKHKRPGALVPPSLPVAILNSTQVPDAAHRLSTTLHIRGVKILGVGNVPGPRPAGLQVLYAADDRIQAERLAALLSRRRPSLAPIDPATQAAAGPNAKLVVVIG